MAKTAKKYDYTTAIENITNNPPFLNACFDSVRAGNPIMVDVSTDPELSISCLEYILDAVIVSNEKPTRVNLEIFEQLATIDLNAKLCHEIGVIGNPSVVSCLPHVMNAYVSATKKGVMNFSDGRGSKLVDQNAALKRVSNAMRSIVSRYPDLMADRICRPSPGSKVYGDHRDHYTCINKIISMGYNVDFVKAEDFPDRYFNTPLCMGNTGGAHSCYDRLIQGATTVGTEYSSTNMLDNYSRLLESMIQSKKYERELFTNSGMCTQRSAIDDAANCLEKMIHSNPNHKSAKLHSLLLNAYSTGYSGQEIIDEVSEFSPFSGKKCLSSSGLDIFTSCIDKLLQTSMTMRTSGDISATRTTAWDNVKYIIKHKPKTSDPCKQLELIKSLIKSLSSGVTGAWLDATSRELMSSILDSALPRKDSTLDELAAITCMSNIGGRDHNVNGVDYALELGSPMTYLMYEYGTGDTHIDYVLKRLSEPICTSIETGSTISCFEKLATELFFEPMLFEPGGGTGSGLRKTSEFIADIILERSEFNSSIREAIYPEGKSYFTDYLATSVYDATVKTNSLTAQFAVGFLENMIVDMDRSGVQFTEDTYPRLGKIIDIISYRTETAKNMDLSTVRQILYDKFEWSEENIRKAINSSAFMWYPTDSDEPSNILDILSKWYDKYKETALGEEIKYVASNGVRAVKARGSDGILPEFYRIYMKSASDRTPTTPEINQLFEVVYGKSMAEQFKPSLEARMEYDKQCFGKKFIRCESGTRSRDAPGIDHVYKDIPGSSKLKPDDLDIVGVYDVTDGATGMWGSEHIWTYANTMRKILWGSNEVIGKPYMHVREESKWKPVPVGLVDAVNQISMESPPELVGERKRNLRGRLKMRVTPGEADVYHRVDPFDYNKNTIDHVVKLLKRNGGDFVIDLYYVDEEGRVIPEKASRFKLIEAMNKMPGKLKKNLQAKYPVLFGQLSAVIEIEKSAPEDITNVKRYKMVISNKPTDIIRCSACQAWHCPEDSCISIFNGMHNSTLQCYLKGGSYIAYLTNVSEYEPEWRARLLIHKCDNNKKSVAIQNQVRRYDMTIRSGSQVFPNWKILYEAVQVALADKGVNSEFDKQMPCNFTWLKDDAGKPRKIEIDDEGRRMCDEEEDRQIDRCIENCYDNCGSSDNYDPEGSLEKDVESAVDKLIAKELIQYKREGGDYTISDDEIAAISDNIWEDEADDIRSKYIDTRVEDCRSGCGEMCSEYVSGDFDCRDYLEEVGYFENGGNRCRDVAYADHYAIDPLKAGSTTYKSILEERTGQSNDSLLFVKRVKTEF